MILSQGGWSYIDIKDQSQPSWITLELAYLAELGNFQCLSENSTVGVMIIIPILSDSE